MEFSLRPLFFQKLANPVHGRDNSDDQCDPVVANEITGANHDPGQERQLLVVVLEYVDDFGNYVGQHEADDRDCGDDQCDRINQCISYLLLQYLARFGEIGQALQDCVKMSRLFSCSNGGSVQLGKCLWEVGETVGQ